MNSTVETPASSDVLCGQDATYGQHPGNTLLRQQIELALDPYIKATDRREKIAKIDEIITVMRINYRSRFLRHVQGIGKWQEVSEQSVRDKVSHALRFASRRREKKTKKIIKPKPRKNKSSCAKKKPRASSVTSTEGGEELGDATRARLTVLHKRQQMILGKMLEEPSDDEEDSPMDTALEATHSSRKLVSGDSRDAALEEKLQKELDEIEPIPFCRKDQLQSEAKLQSDTEPVWAISRSPSSEDEGFDIESRKIDNSILIPIPAKGKVFHDFPTETEHCPSDRSVHQLPRNIEPAWSGTRPRFALRTDDHFAQHHGYTNPTPPPPSPPPSPYYAVSYEPREIYEYHRPSYLYSPTHYTYNTPPPPSATYPHANVPYNTAPSCAPTHPPAFPR